MSFSGDAKRELCRLPVQRSCCARVEAYGALLYCHTFTPREVRIITENQEFAQRLPVLRPLIGMDKTEIVAKSREIGTFETSIEPYEDCCTIFTPAHPKTRPTLAEIEEAEAGMPGLTELEAEAAANVEKIRIRIGDDPEL